MNIHERVELLRDRNVTAGLDVQVKNTGVYNYIDLIKLINELYEEYLKAKENEEWIECLNAAGVDNWDGYDEAQKLLKESR